MTTSEIAIVMLCVWVLAGSVLVMALSMRALLLKRRARRALLQGGEHTIPPDVYARLRTKPRAKLIDSEEDTPAV